MDKIVINKRLILYFICFLFIIEPKIFTQYTATILIFSLGNLIIFAWFLIKRFNNPNNKLNNLLALWCVYRIYTFIVMIPNENPDITTWGYLSLMVANIIMIFDYSLQQNDIKNLLKAISLVGILYLAINLWTLIYYERGIIKASDLYESPDGDIYFLGIKVNFTSYIYAFLSVNFTYSLLTQNKKTLLINIILSILNLLVSNVTTGIIMLVIFPLVIVLFNTILKKHKLTMGQIVIFALILNIFFVFYDFSNFLTPLFEMFGKSADMTGRTEIWKIAKAIIFESPFKLIVGHGTHNNGAWVPFGLGYWPAHNFLLQYLYEDGVIGMVILFSFICNDNKGDIGVKSPKNRTIIKVLNAFCVVIMIATITNSVFSIAHYYIPFLLIKYIRVYDKIEVTKYE